MNTKKTLALTATFALLSLLGSCSQSGDQGATEDGNAAHSGGTHTHADGTVHANDAHDAPPPDAGHGHDEVSIGTVIIGEMKIELAQGHGAVEAGKEGHLVVKLPYSDKGATIVRAWIGTEDRTLSFVGKADYAASHDDYDVHAMAPDPLPEKVMWWIEIVNPDGDKAIGSAKPLLK